MSSSTASQRQLLLVSWNNIRTIFQRELRSYFNSAIAYVVIVVFLRSSAGSHEQSLPCECCDAPVMFEIIPAVFLFVVPAITMRLLSKKEGGTIELLTTKPLHDFEIVLEIPAHGCSSELPCSDAGILYHDRSPGND